MIAAIPFVDYEYGEKTREGWHIVWIGKEIRDLFRILKPKWLWRKDI